MLLVECCWLLDSSQIALLFIVLQFQRFPYNSEDPNDALGWLEPIYEYVLGHVNVQT